MQLSAAAPTRNAMHRISLKDGMVAIGASVATATATENRIIVEVS